ncbi:MAG TPA: hypothetical protein DDZ32_03980 [Gammaproteobacteria bacterium]|nr:hypothetical protein [Gammaproteobacteria bacterium]HBK11978.1 hypothetical protein [Gammaproteobacteria bacterium]
MEVRKFGQCSKKISIEFTHQQTSGWLQTPKSRRWRRSTNIWGRTIEALADVINIDVRVSTMEVDFFKVVANALALTPAQIMVLLKSAVDP